MLFLHQATKKNLRKEKILLCPSNILKEKIAKWNKKGEVILAGCDFHAEITG